MSDREKGLSVQFEELFWCFWKRMTPFLLNKNKTSVWNNSECGLHKGKLRNKQSCSCEFFVLTALTEDEDGDSVENGSHVGQQPHDHSQLQEHTHTQTDKDTHRSVNKTVHVHKVHQIQISSGMKGQSTQSFDEFPVSLTHLFTYDNVPHTQDTHTRVVLLAALLK